MRALVAVTGVVRVQCNRRTNVGRVRHSSVALHARASSGAPVQCTGVLDHRPDAADLAGFSGEKRSSEAATVHVGRVAGAAGLAR